MERMTEKIDFFGNNIYSHNENLEEVEENAIEKLGILEDLEEKLGLPLDVFLKIMLKEQDVFMIDDNFVTEFDSEGIIDDYFYEKVYCRGCEVDIKIIRFKDFNVSWFLTKKEAERKLEELKSQKNNKIG